MLSKTRRELLAGMDSEELGYWTALYTRIDPLPEDRADLRMGIAVANGLLPHLKKGAAAPKPADFMPRFDGEPKKQGQTIEQMKAIWGQAVRAAAGKRKKR